MPVITCPTCGTKLEIDADQMGEEVQCGSCQQIFTAKDERGSGRSRKSASRRDEDEEDYRPRRRSKYRRDDADDDDDYAPRPRRTRDGRNPGSGLGVTALVLGILALPFGVCCGIFGMVFGVLAIVFGFVSLNTEGRGMGIAGIITGGLSILLAVLFLAVGVGFNLFNRAAAPPPAQPAPAVRFK